MADEAHTRANNNLAKKITGKSLEQLAKRPATQSRANSLEEGVAAQNLAANTLHRPNRRVPKPPVVPARSDLQLANGQAKWMSNFILHRIHPAHYDRLDLSADTISLIGQHADLCDELRDCIERDYQIQKERMQAEKKARRKKRVKKAETSDTSS